MLNKQATAAQIYNVIMEISNTEYNFKIPDQAKKVLIRLRDTAYTGKLAYTSGKSGTEFLTLPVGVAKTIDGVYLVDKTFYFQSDGASQVMEIEVWI